MLNIVKWFKPGASARDKERAAAENLAEVEANIDRLNSEAGELYLGGAGNDRRLHEIEAELRDLVPRREWLHRARDRAAAQAAADDAASEAETQRKAAEAKALRIAELRARHDVNASKIAPAARALVQAANEYAASAADLAQEIGGDEARRLLGPLALRFRFHATLWRTVREWIPYDIGIIPEAKRDLAELEREIVAGLLGEGNQPVASSNDDDNEPRAA